MIRTSASLLAAATLLLAPAVSPAQSLNGAVSAADTGSPLTHGTVVAIRVTPVAGERPVIYKATLNSAGTYAVPVSSGQYRLCVYGAEPYLDPCQWGGSPTPTVTASAVSTPLSLQKGVQLIVRVHDLKRVLPAAESVPGAAVKVSVTGASISPRPLPVISDAGIARDHGMFIPFNTPLTVLVSSTAVQLATNAGATLNPAGIPVLVSPGDFQHPNPLSPSLAHMFPRPTAKVVHVYANSNP